ncbi:MAG: O-antigen ligase family protein [Thermodesulfobacteriota bacterium]
MAKTSFFLYLLALIIAPLAFGTCETWSLTFMESTVFAATSLFFLARYRNQTRPLRKTPGLLFILLLPGFFLLQLLPLPGPVLKFFSPATYELYASSVGLISPLNWLSISLHKKATLAEFFRFAAYSAIYFLTIQLTDKRQRLKTTIYTIVFTGASIAILAIGQRVSADGLIYWFRAAPGKTVMGPYVYHNHFAGYMEMIFPLALCLFLWTKPTGEGLTTFRESFIDFFNKPGVSSHTLLGVAATIMATSVFFSLSRGGIISLCIALFGLLFVLAQRKSLRNQRLRFILIPIATLIFVGWFGWEPIIERFLQIKSAGGIDNGRFLIWQDTLPMLKDFILTGSGAGSFATTFPAYQTFRFVNRIITHAHNDYLELLSTTGLVGTFLVVAFLFNVIKAAGKIIRNRHDQFAIYLWGASLTGMFSIFLHSVTDFNFYNGANGLYFFTICGLLVSGAASRRQTGKRSMLATYNFTRQQLLLPTVVVTLLLLAGLLLNIRAMMATGHFNAVRHTSLNTNISKEKLLAMKTRADLAVQLDPLAARNFYLQANIESFLHNNETATTAFRQAIELAPLKGEYLQRYGTFLNTIKTGIDPEPLIRAATLINPVTPEFHLLYGNWLIDHQQPAKGFKQLQTGLTLNPRQLTNQLAILTTAGFKGETLQKILPDGIRPRLTLVRFLDQIDRLHETTAVIRQIESMLETSEEITPGRYRLITNYYTRLKMLKDALRVARQGVERFQDDSRSRIQLGNLLHKSGLHAEAEAAFGRAISLAPSDIYPRIKLASFLASTGRAPEAARIYQQAVKIMARAEDLKPWHIKTIFNYYYRTREYDLALTVVNKGIKALPSTSAVRIILGDAYRQMGRKLDARVEYQRVLARDPGNSEARLRLKNLAVPH